MICNKCNHKLPDDSTFCQYCGNRINLDAINNVSTPVIPSKMKKTEVKDKKRKSTVDISKYSILCLIVPFVLMIICLNAKSIYSHTELLYFVSLALYVLIFVFNIIAIIKNVSSIVFYNIPWFISVGTIIPFFTEDIWNDGNYKDIIEVMLIISVLFLIINITIQLYSAITFNVNKYHTTASYKMKCYEKIDKINTLKEKGIMSEDEFFKIKQQILDKIL